ncbi:MAG TPA: hypothetical protein ENH82_07115 [bacterium]|nr:hypothetical protein [bacterium]
MGVMIACCGDEIDNFDYEAAIQDINREGAHVVSFGVYCKRCYDWFKKEGLILETEQEQEAWLCSG